MNNNLLNIQHSIQRFCSSWRTSSFFEELIIWVRTYDCEDIIIFWQKLIYLKAKSLMNGVCLPDHLKKGSL